MPVSNGITARKTPFSSLDRIVNNLLKYREMVHPKKHHEAMIITPVPSSRSVNRRKAKKGLALASILMIVGIVLVIAMSIGSISIFQLNLATKLSSDTKARMAAESELNNVLLSLIKNPGYGQNNEREEWQDAAAGTSAKVSFNKADDPYSTNNYYTSAAGKGWNNRQVPPNAIHVVTEGHCGTTVKRMEMIVKKGVFPYAVATTAKIQSLNSPLWVEGVLSTNSLLAGIKDRPGSIHSNSTASVAVEAPEKSYITGVASAQGGIDIKMPSQVAGGIRANSGEVEIPFMNVSSFDPKDTKGVIALSSSSYNGLTLNTVYRTTGKIDIIGDLNLESGILYSEGDITVTGKVIGNGALISKGKVSIARTSDLSASNQVAIVADGDVTVAGQGSFLQGLVYTHGNFYGENFTLAGSLIAQSSEESKGQAILKDVKLVYNKEAAEISITSPVTTATPAATPAPPAATSLKGKIVGSGIWPNGSGIDENYELRYDTKDLQGCSEAIDAAISNWNKDTATEMDKYGTLNFYLTCYGKGQSQKGTGGSEHLLATGMVDLWNQLQSGNPTFNDKWNKKLGAKTPLNENTVAYLKTLLLSLKDKIAAEQAAHPSATNTPAAAPAGATSGTVTTDFSLNKYLTRVLPTQITFQGELP
jgi:hypothetical protein